MEINLVEALEATQEIIQKAQTVPFGKYSSVYVSPTGNVKSVLQEYHQNEKVLTIGAMGAYAYEAMLHGAKEIDLFDINILQYLYYELINLGIRTFSFEQFIHNFTTYFSNSEFEKKDLFQDVKELLRKEDTIMTEYFRKLLEIYSREEIIQSKLFNDLNANRELLERHSSLYNEKEFYRIKNLLISKQVHLNYQLCDIVDITEHFDTQYDLLLLDNVLQFYQKIPRLETVSKVNDWLENTIKKILKPNGQGKICYGHRHTALYMMELDGKLDPAYPYYDEIYGVFRLKLKKDGIIPKLYELSNDYTVNIFQEGNPLDSFSKHCFLSYDKGDNLTVKKKIKVIESQEKE